MNDEDPTTAPIADQAATVPGLPSSLTGRQRTLHQRLVDLDEKRGGSLGAMYVGALVVANSDGPDRNAQAAHSCRELIGQLVRVRVERQSPGGPGNPRDRGIELQKAWEDFRRRTGKRATELVGGEVDLALSEVLQRLEVYCEAGSEHKPRRRTQVERALKTLGLTDEDLPAPLQEADIEALKKLWDFFEKAAHHDSKACTSERVRAEIKRLEDLLMRMVPETFADLDEIDRLIGGADA